MLGTTSSIEYKSQSISLVPVMSSADNGTIQIIVSNEWDATYAGWKAFDGVISSDICWHTSRNGVSYPEYLGFYNIKQSRVTHINMFIRPSQPACIPGAWSLQGSNDKISWDTIQSYTNGSGSISVDVNAYNNWYYHYRIYISAAAGGDHLAICELQFMGYYRQ